MRRFITEIAATRIERWVEADYDDLGLLHICVGSLMCYFNQRSNLPSGQKSCVGYLFRAQPTFDGRCCVAWLFSLCRVDKTVFLSCRNSSFFLGMKLPLMEITQRALSSSSVCVMVLMCDDVKGLGATPVLTHISCALALSEVLQIGEELCTQSKIL